MEKREESFLTHVFMIQILAGASNWALRSLLSRRGDLMHLVIRNFNAVPPGLHGKSDRLEQPVICFQWFGRDDNRSQMQE